MINAYDIFERFIGDVVFFSNYTLLDSQGQIEEILNFIMEYTNEKLLLLGDAEDLVVDDMGVMLDKFDSYFARGSKQERDFYKALCNFVLFRVNELSEKTILLVPVKVKQDISYPRITDGGPTNILYLETDGAQNEKEAVIFLVDYLRKMLKKETIKIQYQKK